MAVLESFDVLEIQRTITRAKKGCLPDPLKILFAVYTVTSNDSDSSVQTIFGSPGHQESVRLTPVLQSRSGGRPVDRLLSTQNMI